MSFPILTFEAEMQPYINAQGASDLPQTQRAGKGSALFTPTIATRFSDTPASGTALPPDARHAYVTVKAGGIRARTDGTNPTPTTDLYIPAGTMLTFKNQRQIMEQFRFIDSTGETSEVSAMWLV